MQKSELHYGDSAARLSLYASGEGADPCGLDRGHDPSAAGLERPADAISDPSVES